MLVPHQHRGGKLEELPKGGVRPGCLHHRAGAGAGLGARGARFGPQAGANFPPTSPPSWGQAQGQHGSSPIMISAGSPRHGCLVPGVPPAPGSPGHGKIWAHRVGCSSPHKNPFQTVLLSAQLALSFPTRTKSPAGGSTRSTSRFAKHYLPPVALLWLRGRFEGLPARKRGTELSEPVPGGLGSPAVLSQPVLGSPRTPFPPCYLSKLPRRALWLPAGCEVPDGARSSGSGCSRLQGDTGMRGGGTDPTSRHPPSMKSVVLCWKSDGNRGWGGSLGCVGLGGTCPDAPIRDGAGWGPSGDTKH